MQPITNLCNYFLYFHDHADFIIVAVVLIINGFKLLYSTYISIAEIINREGIMCICCWNISACTVQNCGKCAANVDKCEACNDGFYTTSDTSCTGKYRTIISMTDIFRIIYFDTPSYVIFYCVCERQWLSLALSFSPLSLSLSLSKPNLHNHI